MIYPLINQVVDAAKVPQLIKDPFFNGIGIEILPSGRPKMYAGGFSQVFSIKKDEEQWAFKVWITEISKNKERYHLIKPYLNRTGLSYFLDFEYVEGGLLVNGEPLDTLRMPWAEGLPLVNFISLHLNNAAKLERLAEKFLKMTDDLHAHSVSHGDLQHLNIFVSDNEELKLIDYDSVCIPQFEGEPDITRGTKGFQHPSRLSAGYYASIRSDYFSELIIYMSILAIAENPLLWDKYIVTTASDRLLFMPEDFLYFKEASIRKDLLLLSDRIKSLVAILDEYLAAHLLLSPLADLAKQA